MKLAALDQLCARGHWGIKLGLENPRELMARLGHPERAFPVVLIAGTNGKGSTGAFMANALRASGLKVGWTTSPHLVSPAERIWVDGRCLEPQELDAALVRVFEAESGMNATYFELMIAAALETFRERRVDLALVEVGLGGRWDATNALEPILTVLTNVGLDHTQFLGETREAIATEKLCTARSGKPLVLGPELDPEWVKPLLACKPLLRAAKPLRADRLNWDHSWVEGHRVGLAGGHQVSNLSTALEALDALEEIGFPSPHRWEGIAQTSWPGRLWAIPGLENVWADGAHNPDGARALAAHARACGIRPELYFAVMGDKAFAEMAEALRSIEPFSITLVVGSDPRYAKAEALREVWGELPVLSLEEAAARLRQPSVTPRLVTGSLYFIGDLLGTLGIRPQA